MVHIPLEREIVEYRGKLYSVYYSSVDQVMIRALPFFAVGRPNRPINCDLTAIRELRIVPFRDARDKVYALYNALAKETQSQRARELTHTISLIDAGMIISATRDKQLKFHYIW